ncbi:DUF1192 domain-containing protein [Martelella limonii]|uniref:DUF1192 domain-containing protein n=1 Tax=Martelella limonii TaxID=1647649 RepID=UPI001580D3C4|nr:DUF1192 domain-containing protein [Martelella limonii]
MWDDDGRAARKKESYIIGTDLEPHSIEALKGFIGELEAEIERIQTAIRQKGSDRQAAESFFRK